MNSEIYTLRSKRPFHHSVQVSFSVNITLELGLRRWRMKDSQQEKFPRPSSDAPPDWAPSRFLWNQHIQNFLETDVGKLQNLAHNRQFRTRSQDSITYPELPQALIWGEAFHYGRSQSSGKPSSQILGHLPGSSCHRNQVNTFLLLRFVLVWFFVLFPFLVHFQGVI